MKAIHAPAAFPALVFLVAAGAESRLLPTPVGLLAVGIALCAALRGRSSPRFAALFLGLLLARLQSLQSPTRLIGLDAETPVEAVGWVAGDWREEAGGASAPLRLEVLRQASRLWTRAPQCRLELAGSRPLPPPGSRVRVRGHLSRSAGFANAHTVPPGVFRLRVKSSRLLVVERPPSAARRALSRLQETVARPLAESAVRHPGVGYARGLLLGDLEDVPARERLAFRRSGLAHLMAVSGMNVALVAGAAAALAAYCGRRLRLAIVAAAVLLHLAVVGPVPSLLRATLMTGAALLGLVLERRALALQSLSIAAAAMVAVDPSLVRDLGFCLSCSATVGLIVLAPATLAGWPARRNPLLAALAVSWSAQSATLPWALSAFAYISPAAPLFNLIAVPIAGLLLVGALGWIAVALLLPGARDLAALPLDLLAAPLRWLPALPAGSWLCLPLPPSWALGVALAALATIAAASPAAARRALLLTLLVTAAPAPPPTSAVSAAGADHATGAGVEWVVADVGQGDGMLLVRGPVAILVDGGGGAGSSRRRTRDYATAVWLPLLGTRGITRLAAVVVSHSDGDHCGGLVDVASYVAIDEVWATGELAESSCVRDLLELSRATFKGLARGDRLDRGGLDFEVLGPSPGGSGKENDRSLVLALSAEGRRVLLTGDIERRGELELLARAPEALRCDLLKVAHHGSATSSGQRFLAAARPRLSVISCGVENRFGHPDTEVVARLDAAGGPVLRTDRSGAVVVRWRRGWPLELEFPGSPRAALR